MGKIRRGLQRLISYPVALLLLITNYLEEDEDDEVPFADYIQRMGVSYSSDET